DVRLSSAAVVGGLDTGLSSRLHIIVEAVRDAGFGRAARGGHVGTGDISAGGGHNQGDDNSE
ncbi:MAG TPA: hypothetical protein VJ991_02950, partial [Balneolales bacterium]|nr:hypothetical protein [Balneolales bacterium]